MTVGGAKRLREELDQLLNSERPRLLAARQPELVRRELQVLDQKIASLGESLQSAEIVFSPAAADGVVRFGAYVTVRSKSGEETAYRIVGLDETDMDRDWVSWLSPIARALLNTRVGERVRFRFPAGEKELEILSVHYE